MARTDMMAQPDRPGRGTAVVPHDPSVAATLAQPAPPGRRAWLPWTVAAVAVIGAVVVLVAGRDGAVRDRASYVTESARTTDLEDVVEATGTLRYADGARVVARSPVDGVVTDVPVVAGDRPAAFEPVLAIDGQDRYLLPSDGPLHRPLAEGDEGDDVEGVEEALRAAGFDPGDVDGTFTADTAAALADWQDEVGLPTSGALDPAVMLWGPIDPAVLTVEVARGDPVTTGQPLLSMGVPDRFVLEAEIDQGDVAEVAPGDLARIEIDGVGAMDATVERIAPVPSEPGAEVYVASITAVSWRPEVRAGMHATVEVVVDVVRDAVVVPTGAVGGTTADPSVPVLVDGMVEDRPVTLGLVTAAWAQVVSGIEPGETIVLGEES